MIQKIKKMFKPISDNSHIISKQQQQCRDCEGAVFNEKFKIGHVGRLRHAWCGFKKIFISQRPSGRCDCFRKSTKTR